MGVVQRDRSWLFSAYVLRGQTLREIAADLGCSHQSVATALAVHNIGRRPPSRRFVSPRLTDPNWLREQYEHDRRTTVEIGSELGVTPGTVSEALRRCGIRPRPPRHHRASATL